MSDLIRRADAIYALEEQLDYLNMLNKDENPTAESNWYGVNWARNTIADLPSAERNLGEWIKDKNGVFICSNCNNGYRDQPTLMGKPMFQFCPTCGARMGGE